MRTLGRAGFLPALLLGMVLSASVRAQSVSLTTLHDFTAGEGTGNLSSLVQSSDGTFYGTTSGGGANNTGTIFKMAADGTLTVLHAFAAYSGGANDGGAMPFGALVAGGDGYFYGTTNRGGSVGFGTIFKISPAGAFATVHNFDSSHLADVASPIAGLVRGTDGALYGTTQNGGTNSWGTVFRLNADGTTTLLHSFAPVTTHSWPFLNADGAYPNALVLASDGYFYGTTSIGGANGQGTLFRIDSAGNFALLHTFSAITSGTVNAEGAEPNAGLVQGMDGSLYGTAKYGGPNGYGTVFKITTGGTYTLLHSFLGYGTDEGVYPDKPLIQAGDGSFYGTTSLAGAYNGGTIYQITSDGSLTTVYAFDGSSNGGSPSSSLSLASDGSMYGLTGSGGTNGYGTAYQIIAASAPVLSSLSTASINAGGPNATLTLKGSNFTSSSVAQWAAGTTTTALSTTFVSSTQLKAVVPSALTANPGKASVTVSTANAGVSGSKAVTIKETTLMMVVSSLTKNSTTGVITASVSLQNVGYLTASNTALSSAVLGTAATTTSLPLRLGSIAAGTSVTTSLTFPPGTSGTKEALKLGGSFTAGKFSTSKKVASP